MATIHHQVWINAQVAKVYEAISTADGIGTWWDKQTPTQTDRGMVLEHNPGPEHGVVKLRVVELVPSKRVEWECISTHPKNTPAASWTGTQISFQITEREKLPPRLFLGQPPFRHWRFLIFATRAGTKTVITLDSAASLGVKCCKI